MMRRLYYRMVCWWSDRAYRRCGRTTGHRWRLVSHIQPAYTEDVWQARHVCELCRGYRVTIIPYDVYRLIRGA